jgi:hypothetical protein
MSAALYCIASSKYGVFPQGKRVVRHANLRDHPSDQVPASHDAGCWLIPDENAGCTSVTVSAFIDAQITDSGRDVRYAGLDDLVIAAGYIFVVDNLPALDRVALVLSVY